MTSVKVTIKGEKKLKDALRRAVDGASGGLRTAIARGAAELQAEAVKTIRGGTRSGVIVQRGGKPHQRSAPGEPPKTDTGRLVASIFAEVTDDGRDRVSAEVGTDLAYGGWLEDGTLKMPARPWLQPTFERLKERIVERIRKAARRGLDKRK